MRIAVAMSGGVDSSVAAALLLDQGHELVGLTLRFWLCGEGGGGGARSCCGVDGAAEARAAAGELAIPHYVIDCRDEFERQVLRPAWDDYAAGRTPNPCVLCNQRIKFGLLLEQARRVGAERVATGHYARVEHGAAGLELRRGRDLHKDQSYFLFSLDDAQLAAALFPLGDLDKEQVRELARRRGLPNAARPESQDACLVGEEGFAEALRLRFGAPARPGPILDPDGRQLGEHAGIHRFTVGQRRGLGVALGRRSYVLGIDPERAAVRVGADPAALDAAGLLAGGVRWRAGAPEPGRRCLVQVRYRHAAVPATLEPAGAEQVRLRFEEPQRAVTPGQAAVCYDGERVLGGGWIERALASEEIQA